MNTPQQDYAVFVVQFAHEGAAPSMLDVVDVIGPSRRYGYATIHRAIKNGKLKLDPSHPKASARGAGALVFVGDDNE